MLRLDDARSRQDSMALAQAAAIDACRRAADACAQRFLAATGDFDADDRVRLAMDGVEVFGATAGMIERRSPWATSALALCEDLARGCAIAFDVDERGEALAAACRECARCCRVLRTSVTTVRTRCAAA